MTGTEGIKLEERIRELLPHGSGIDGDWQVLWNPKRKAWVCENSFHVMNNVGYYVGWCDFRLVIPEENPQEFRLHFLGPNRWMARYYHLRDFLEDSFYWALCPLWEGKNDE